MIAKVQHILNLHQDEEEQINDRNGESLPAPANAFFYVETQGCITNQCEDVTRRIMIWIASHDHLIHSVYLGGSSAWIEATSHYLSFRAIPDHLLPARNEHDPHTWWIVSDPEYTPGPHVIKVSIVEEDQMTKAFPDLWS